MGGKGGGVTRQELCTKENANFVEKRKSRPSTGERLKGHTLTHGCLKVHGGVPIVLCIFVDPI